MASTRPLAAFPMLQVFLAAALLAPAAVAAPAAPEDAPDPLKEKRAEVQKFFEKGEPIPPQVRQEVARAAQLPPKPGMTPEQADQLKQDAADLAKAVEQAIELQTSADFPRSVKQGDELAVQVTGRVQETCVLLKIVDVKRQEEAVKLYVSRWQSGRTDLTPEKAAKEHRVAQAALHRGQERQRAAQARISGRLRDGFGTTQRPGEMGGAAVGRPGGVVDAAALKDNRPGTAPALDKGVVPDPTKDGKPKAGTCDPASDSTIARVFNSEKCSRKGTPNVESDLG